MGAPKPTKPPWPEYAEPPREVWVDWFMEQSEEWQRHYLAETAWKALGDASRCSMDQHEDRIQDLKNQVNDLHRYGPEDHS